VSDVDSSDVTFGGPMFVEGALTHPCHSFAVGKPAMVVVRVQGAPAFLILALVITDKDHRGNTACRNAGTPAPPATAHPPPSSVRHDID
jgi:hypothetical protein